MAPFDFDVEELCSTLTATLLTDVDETNSSSNGSSSNNNNNNSNSNNEEEEEIDMDEDLISYLGSIISESDTFTVSELAASSSVDHEEGSAIYDAIGPFLESSGCGPHKISMVCQAVIDLARKIDPASFKLASHSSNAADSQANAHSQANADSQSNSQSNLNLNLNSNSHSQSHSQSQSNTDALPETRKLKQGIVSLSTNLEAQTLDEADTNAYLWGKNEGVAAFTNVAKDAHTTTVSAKDKRKAKQELERVRREYQVKMEAMAREEESQGGEECCCLKNGSTGL